MSLRGRRGALFPLAAIFGEPFFRWLGAAVAACGVVGLVIVAAGAGAAPVAAISGVVPGALLLAWGWWGANRVQRQRSVTQ